MLDPTHIRMQCQLIPIEQLQEFIYYNNLQTYNIREYKWRTATKSKYIESILLRLPMAPFYLNYATTEADTDEYDEDDGYDDDYYEVGHIIDGAQRILTILEYKRNDFALTETEFEFNPPIDGKKFSELPHHLQRRINESHIPIHAIENTTPYEVAKNIANRLNMAHLQPRNRE